MAQTDNLGSEGDVWFVYDGDCPICTAAANALQIRRDVGALHLVNARDDKDHPLMQEVNRLGLDLDEGMVLKFRGAHYHGDDALHMMALLGSPHGWMNRINAWLFKSKTLARLCYPAMRAGRNTLLRLTGVTQLRNLQRESAGRDPIFKPVFGAAWGDLPKVMHDHYAVRPYSNDSVTVKGTLDVTVSPLMGLLTRLSGMLVSRSGEQVPITVIFRSGEDCADFTFDRIFHFPDGDEHFRSRMTPAGGNELIEFMGFGIGWRVAYSWDGAKVILAHRGYVWRLLGVTIPVPLGLIIGRGEAEETPLSGDEFSMWTHAKHPWFGVGLAYSGTFKVTDVSCQDRS